MTRWPHAPLGDVCHINPRLASHDRPLPNTMVGFVPMAAVCESDGAITAVEPRPYAAVAKGFTPFRTGDVIFAKITPCMENGKAALVGELPSGLGFGSTEFHVLRVRPVIMPELLHAWVRRPQFRREAKANFVGSAGQQRVPAAFLERATMPLPPLDEQRRIVEVLDRAAGIRRLREAALAKARETIPALFLSLFGDPATNPMGWPVVALGEVLKSATYGTSKKANTDQTGVAVLRMGNVTMSGNLDLRDIKHVALDRSEIAESELRAGDLLFNRTNSKELVGKTGLWDGRMHAVAASYFIRLRTREDVASPTYVWAFMNSAHMKARLFATARGAIGQANINTRELRAFTLPLPPLALQHRFAARLADLRAIIARQERALAAARELEAALLARLLG